MDLEDVIRVGQQLLAQEQQESGLALEAANAAYTESNVLEFGREGMDPDLAEAFNANSNSLRLQSLIQNRQLVRTMGRMQVMLQAIGAWLVKVDAPATNEAAAAAATPPAETTPVA